MREKTAFVICELSCIDDGNISATPQVKSASRCLNQFFITESEADTIAS